MGKKKKKGLVSLLCNKTSNKFLVCFLVPLLFSANPVRVIRWHTSEIYIVAVLTRWSHILFEQRAYFFSREVGETY